MKYSILAACLSLCFQSKAQTFKLPHTTINHGSAIIECLNNGKKEKHTFNNSIKIDSFWLSNNRQFCKKTIKLTIISVNNEKLNINPCYLVEFINN